MKKHKAILIDVEKRDVREVTLGKGISDIYKFLKCGCFCLAMRIGQENILMVDDEGYLKQGPKKFFKFKSMEPMQWLAGNGLIVGEDDECETCDVCDINIEKLKADLVFMDCDDEKSCPKLPLPKIISF